MRLAARVVAVTDGALAREDLTSGLHVRPASSQCSSSATWFVSTKFTTSSIFCSFSGPPNSIPHDGHRRPGTAHPDDAHDLVARVAREDVVERRRRPRRIGRGEPAFAVRAVALRAVRSRLAFGRVGPELDLSAMRRTR